MKRVSETFKVKLEAIFAAPMCTAGALLQMPKIVTVPVYQSGDILFSVGPLDRNKFQHGDIVRVTVERLPAKRKGKRP